MVADMNIKHKTDYAIFPVQDELYLRISATIFNHMGDYEKLVDVLCQLPRKC